MYVSSITPEFAAAVVTRIRDSLQEELTYKTIEDQFVIADSITAFEQLATSSTHRLTNLATAMLTKPALHGTTEVNYIMPLIKAVSCTRYLYSSIHRKEITIKQ